MGRYRKVFYEVGTDGAAHSGVRAGYEYRVNRVSLRGWYDSFVGIEPVVMSLGDFLRGLGITAEECRKVLEGD